MVVRRSLIRSRTRDRTSLDKFPSRFQLSARQPELRFNPTLHRLLSCFHHPLSFLLAGKKTFVLECSIKACIPRACAQICRTRSMYRKRYSSKHSCITVHRHLFWPSYFAHIPNGCTLQSQSETLWPAAKLGPKRQHAALFLHSSCDCIFLCLSLCVFPCLIAGLRCLLIWLVRWLPGWLVRFMISCVFVGWPVCLRFTFL